jgi:hypothetical protein
VRNIVGTKVVAEAALSETTSPMQRRKVRVVKSQQDAISNDDDDEKEVGGYRAAYRELALHE